MRRTLLTPSIAPEGGSSQGSPKLSTTPTGKPCRALTGGSRWGGGSHWCLGRAGEWRGRCTQASGGCRRLLWSGMRRPHTPARSAQGRKALASRAAPSHPAVGTVVRRLQHPVGHPAGPRPGHAQPTLCSEMLHPCLLHRLARAPPTGSPGPVPCLPTGLFF